MAKKITAAELNEMIDNPDYSAPEPRTSGAKVIAELDSQKEAADFVKNALTVFGHGVSQGLSDEVIGFAKTGSISSPEYKQERNKIRSIVNTAREGTPLSPVVEAVGGVIPELLMPAVSGPMRVARSLGLAALQGSGEAKELEDIPKEAATGAGLQGVGEVIGAGVNKLFLENPLAIRTRSLGVKGSQLTQEEGRTVKDSIDRLNQAGFFKHGEVQVSPLGQKFERVKTDLDTYLKPKNLRTFSDRAEKAIATLKDVNNSLIANKKIPQTDLINTLDTGIAEMTYDPMGFDVSARADLAQGVKNTILSDLIQKGQLIPGNPVSAEAIETAKRSLDAHMGSPAFRKRAEDLGINPEALMLFRTKLDDLVDTIGGATYKKNNDMMSDLIKVKQTIDSKINKSYVDAGNEVINPRNYSRILGVEEPVQMALSRAAISEGLDTGAGQFATQVLKRTPVEMFTRKEQFNGNRKPDSVNFSPEEIVSYRIPRDTQGLLADKDKVLAKIVQSGAPSEMVDAIGQALNGDPEDVSNIAPLVMSQFPTLFQKGRYKTFDGKIVDPNDRARAADDISKREDMGSIERAKIISNINKDGTFPESLNAFK